MLLQRSASPVHTHKRLAIISRHCDVIEPVNQWHMRRYELRLSRQIRGNLEQVDWSITAKEERRPQSDLHITHLSHTPATGLAMHFIFKLEHDWQALFLGCRLRFWPISSALFEAVRSLACTGVPGGRMSRSITVELQAVQTSRSRGGGNASLER